MRRLWPSRLAARAPRIRAVRFARSAQEAGRVRRIHSSPSTYNASSPQKDGGVAEELDSPDPGPPPGPGVFKDHILSLTSPQEAAEGLGFLQPLQDALLSAFLPINQHVESARAGPSKNIPPAPFGVPHGSFQILQGGATVQASESSSEPVREAVIAVTSPFEGGRCYNFDAVKLIASTLDAEVLRLDLVLGLGLNGSGTAFDQVPFAPSLPTSLNPPLQDQKALANPRSEEVHEFDEEEGMEDAEDEPETRAIVVSPMFPQQGGRGSPSGSSLEGIKEPWVKYFTNILSAHPSSLRRRILYLEAADSMAPSFGVWWQSLVEAVRQYRRGKRGRKPSNSEHDLVIVLSFTPSLLPQHTAPTPSTASPSGLNPALRFLMSQNSPRTPSGSPLWYAGSEADFSAREDRVAKRLSQMAEGNEKSLIPTLPLKSTKPSLPIPFPILQMLSGQEGSSGSDQDLFSRIIWKTIPVLPDKRDRRREQLERMTSRLATSAAIIHNALAPYGARIGDIDVALEEVGNGTMYSKSQKAARTTYSIAQERRAAQAFESVKTTHIEWQNNIISSEAAQRLASTATGNRLRADRDLALTWSDVVAAAEHESELSTMFKRHISSFTPTKPATRNQTLVMTPSKAKESTSSIIASVKSASDLSAYERRLLPCIVDSSRLSTGTFGNVHLPVQTIDTIRTLVTLPLLYPDAFRSGVLRDHSTTGALLFGPPGTGKTLLARAVANESGARMIAIQPSDVNDKYLGEGEKLVKGIFSLARRLAPCVVFIDEVDSLFGARAGKSGASAGNRHHDQLLTEFMQEMDGLSSAEANTKKGIVVIGATNRPFDLDDAILRRLPRRLLVDLPDVKSRKAILEIMLRGENRADDVDLEHIAKETDGYSGSDLKHLCVSAALAAIKEVVKVPWRTRDDIVESEKSPRDGLEARPILESATDDQAKTLLANDEGSSETPEDTDEAVDDTPERQPIIPSTPLDRRLTRKHFETALKEIRPSASEEGTLPELRRWAEQFGEGGSQRGKKKGFGKGFGFSDPTTKTRHEAGYGRVTQE